MVAFGVLSISLAFRGVLPLFLVEVSVAQLHLSRHVIGQSFSEELSCNSLIEFKLPSSLLLPLGYAFERLNRGLE